MSADDDPHAWTRTDEGCAGCGKPYITVADHRCGECIGQPVRHCPHCLTDIAALIDREVVRRLRHASADVNTAWTQHAYYRRYRDRERALDARLAQDGAA